MSDNDIKPLHNGTGGAWKQAADEAKRINDSREKDGSLAWADILLEQVFMALAADSPEGLREELLELSADVANWVADIDAKEGQS